MYLTDTSENSVNELSKEYKYERNKRTPHLTTMHLTVIKMTAAENTSLRQQNTDVKKTLN